MDILKVGTSLGAGAIALQTGSGLHRVGPDGNGTFTLVKEGPLRSIIDLDFEDMELDGSSVNVKHRISIEAGKPYYNSKVFFEGAPNAKLVTGIVNLDSDSVYTKITKSISAFYTYDNQAYEGGKLGLAVIAPQNNLSVATAPEEGEGITQTFYATIASENQPATYSFMAGWEKQNNVFATKKGFEKQLKNQMEQLSASVNVEI
jgi:hypothetical protein